MARRYESSKVSTIALSFMVSPCRIIKGAMVSPPILANLMRVIYSRLLGSFIYKGYPRFFLLVTTRWERPQPILKPVSFIFHISSSRIPYFARTSQRRWKCCWILALWSVASFLCTEIGFFLRTQNWGCLSRKRRTQSGPAVGGLVLPWWARRRIPFAAERIIESLGDIPKLSSRTI